MRTQTKIALILFLSNVMIILMFGSAIYYFINKYSYTDFYKRLQTRATIASKYYLDADRMSAEALKTVREQHLEKLSQEKEYVLETGKDSSLANISKKQKLPLEFLEEIVQSNKANLKDGNTLFTGIKYTTNTKTYLVIVSADNYFSSHHLSFLRNILWTGVALIALITIGFSFYFSKQIFSPIQQITSKVKQISTDNMHLRLPEADNNNEISELILTFNDLLNRMETAFETQKNFVSNASHEFGTPLTAIIGEADVTLNKERKPEDYKEVLQNILKQAERLDQITKSLLFLAQTGYKGKNISFQLVRIDEVIWSVKQVMDNLNPQNKIAVDLSLLPEDPKKLKVNGNKELLNLAFANIFNNACKYSHNKPVNVSIAAGSKEIIVVIKDEGIGIPENEIQFIYDPFFRASNTHFFEGYGIGLPLTRNIIKLHNGKLKVSSVVNSGTNVQITLPLAYPG